MSKKTKRLAGIRPTESWWQFSHIDMDDRQMFVVKQHYNGVELEIDEGWRDEFARRVAEDTLQTIFGEGGLFLCIGRDGIVISGDSKKDLIKVPWSEVGVDARMRGPSLNGILKGITDWFEEERKLHE